MCQNIPTWRRQRYLMQSVYSQKQPLLFFFNFKLQYKLQYRHLIPAPVDRTSASAWSYKHSCITCQKKYRVACEPKLRSVVRSDVHQCPRNWMEIGRAVVYYAWSDQALSAGIKCRHCTLSRQSGI